MAGWQSVGSGLADALGVGSGAARNELAYAKGAAMGANTEVALAKARESVAQEQARQGLAEQLIAAGLPENVARASSGGLSAGAGLGDVISLLGKSQEQNFRDSAVKAALGNDIVSANANLLGVANAPVEALYSVGEGQFANKFSPQTAPTTSPLGDALIGQRNASATASLANAALDDARRLNPEQYRAGNPYLVVGNTPFLKTTGADGQPALAPAQGFSAGALGETAGAIAGGKIAGTNRATLPGKINDFQTMRDSVNRLIQSPGLNSIYGNLAGTGIGQTITSAVSQDAANAMAVRENLGAQAFTVAITKMRGLGALSNAEGAKVEAALTRLTNPRISPDEARVAAADLLVAVNSLEQVARREAGDAAVDSVMNLAPAGATAPVAPSAPGTYADPAKEARYQAWKAAQQGGG